MGKKKSGPGMFADLTVDEASVLGSILGSGAEVARHVNGRGNHKLFMETHDVISDVRDARRERWNRENPLHKIGE